MKTIIVAVIACVCVAGCNSLGYPKTTAWDFDKAPCSEGGCTQNDAFINYGRALKFCRNVSNYYEASGNRANSGRFLLGALGSLAGSVFTKTAKGSAVEAWAGLAGTTSGMQTSLGEVFSLSLSAKRRKAIADAVAVGVGAHGSATSDKDKVEASVAMAAACWAAPNQVDEAVVAAMAAQPPVLPVNAAGAAEAVKTAATEDK